MAHGHDILRQQGGEGLSPSGQAPAGEVVVRLEPSGRTVSVAAGTILEEAISAAGLRVPLPCGGQGRCGRCAVQVQEGSVRRRSTLRLTGDEIDRGYALACQTLVSSDATVWVPPAEERLERLEDSQAAEKTAAEVVRCGHNSPPRVSRHLILLSPPTLNDNMPDLDRLQRELTAQHGLAGVTPSLTALARLPGALRDGGWAVIAEVENLGAAGYRLLDVLSGRASKTALGVAIDIGTTTVAVYLAELATGRLVDQASAFNGQIARGEDVISRIMYAREPKRRLELQELVVSTINSLIDEMLQRRKLAADEITAAAIAGNTTMIHLFLGLEPNYIRLEPYIGAASRFPLVRAGRLGLNMHPEGVVDCLPVVGAYVGGDITAGVLRTALYKDEAVTLFIDVGTNGEMVLGNSEWLVSCACSAGPAFEGAGATSGMRAVSGAVEEVWIDPRNLEPTVKTVGDAAPLGICGSGMIALLGEMLVTGVIDKSGRIASEGLTDRVRRGEHGLEYVVVWAADTATGDRDIVLDEADIQNLLRTKAAIYAGAWVLCDSVGLSTTDVDRVMIAGSFGRHIDIEKAIQIGLLPDLPWDRFQYLGNTSIQGAYLALTCREHRRELNELAGKMTYVELSADNRFMDAFTSALFLPHTDESLFPSVRRAGARVSGDGVRAS